MKNQIIGYDNVCALAAVCKNPCRKSFSEGAKMLSEMRFVHDRLHLKGHTNELCRKIYNLDKIPESAKWNSECAEQEFSDFFRHKSLFHHSSRERSAIWIALIFHEKNIQNEMQINNSRNCFSKRVSKLYSIDDNIRVLTDILRTLP